MRSGRLRAGFVRTGLGIVGGALLLVTLSMTVGCVHVAPYERGTLAHPTMSADDPFTTSLAEHVQDVSEGASGGASAAAAAGAAATDGGRLPRAV